MDSISFTVSGANFEELCERAEKTLVRLMPAGSKCDYRLDIEPSAIEVMGEGVASWEAAVSATVSRDSGAKTTTTYVPDD